MALVLVSTGTSPNLGPAGTVITVPNDSRALRRFIDQGVAEFIDSVNVQGADVAAPAALTAPAVISAVYTQTEVQALRNDVAALQATVAALEVALSGPGRALA